jgi:DnaD/phage-associated family protein
MKRFIGFSEGKINLVPIPEVFFSQILPQIDHLGELKVTLYIFWRLNQMEGAFRYFNGTEIKQDEKFMLSLGATMDEAQAILGEALDRATERGTILKAVVSNKSGNDIYYFLNSPRGRAALRAIEKGQWQPITQDHSSVLMDQEPPNIFRLYEENIGPLTPLIAEALGEAEDTYPALWIEEAIRIAIERNKRNWRYIETILERWQHEGFHGKKEKHTDRRDSEKDRQRYVEGEFSDFVEH